MELQKLVGNMQNKYVKNNIEACIYNSIQISFKDFGKSIDINDSKWDFLFTHALNRTSSFYFLGERLDLKTRELLPLIESLSLTLIENKEDCSKILIKLNPSSLVISRSQLSQLWRHYELPAIFFLVENQIEENKFIEMCNKQITYLEISGSVQGLYLIHRNFEFDVLWFSKSPDMENLVLEE